MPATEDQRAASRINGSRSRGPTSEAGKSASRRNALKHGLTGDGVVLDAEVEAEVEQLAEELQADLRPASPLGRIMVRRLAFTATRMEKCSRQELFADAERARNAGAAFDEKRQAEATHLLDWIAAEPATYARRLRAMPEGLDLMIRTWRGLATDLLKPQVAAWDHGHFQMACNLMGQRTSHFPAPRVGVLSQVIWKDTSYLDPGEARDVPLVDLESWARGEILKIIEAEIAALEALRADIDEGVIEQDRAEAPERAMFDPSKEAILARRYEAAAARAFYKALEQFRAVEAEAAARPPAPEPVEPEEAPGSFFPEAAGPGPEAVRQPIPPHFEVPPPPPAGDPGPIGRPAPPPWEVHRAGSR